MSETPYSCKYAIFRYMLDAKRNTSTPIGVALWSEDKSWVRTRVLQPGETLSSISGQDYSFIRLVNGKLQNWLKNEHLPYDEQRNSPASDRWWRHLQKLLIHKVRIGEPQTVECRDPENELEMIFRAVVDARILFSVGSSSAAPKRLAAAAPYSLSPIETLVLTHPEDQQKRFWGVYDGSEVSVRGFGAYATISPCRLTAYNSSKWLPSDARQENGMWGAEFAGCRFKTACLDSPLVAHEKLGSASSAAVGVGIYYSMESPGARSVNCANAAIAPNTLHAAVASDSLEESTVWILGSFTQATAPTSVYIDDSPGGVRVKERPLVSSTL